MTWTRTNPGAPRDAGSRYQSTDGRFRIDPLFLGCVYPQLYEVRDTRTRQAVTFSTIRDCKAWAADRHGCTP